MRERLSLVVLTRYAAADVSCPASHRWNRWMRCVVRCASSDSRLRPPCSPAYLNITATVRARRGWTRLLRHGGMLQNARSAHGPGPLIQGPDKYYTFQYPYLVWGDARHYRIVSPAFLSTRSCPSISQIARLLKCGADR